jgi:hypothetical protein
MKVIIRRLENLEKLLNPKYDWTKTITSIYIYKGKEYKPNNPLEKGTITIFGLHPNSI